MIKHNLKLKSHKQDLVQANENQKSLFYLTRRVVKTNSDRIIRQIHSPPSKYNNMKKLIKIDPQSSQIGYHYRSASTTPSNFQRQASQNIDDGTQGCTTARQQSTSINSAEFLSSRNIQSRRILSLYQGTVKDVQSVIDVDTVREDSENNNTEQFHPRRLRSIKSDFASAASSREYFILEDIQMIFNTQYKRKAIFANQTYKQDIKITGKLLKKRAGSPRQSIFLQKVLNNIKDSQGEKSEIKQLARKYSKVWQDNFSQPQFFEQQKFSKSSTQFKLYFNLYIGKTLNKERVYTQINQLLEIITKNQNMKFDSLKSESSLRQFYIENHDNKINNEVNVEDEKFRYKRKIESFEMIDMLNEVQVGEVGETIFDIDNFFQQVETKKIEYIQSSFVIRDTQYQVQPLVTTLNNETKNTLLSVDYTDLDEIIYQNNMIEISPKIDESHPIVKKFLIDQIYLMFSDILVGGFGNNNELEDIEHNNAYEQSIPQYMDKKTMMMKLRNQTKEAKVQGRRSTLLVQAKFHPNLLREATNQLLLEKQSVTLQVPGVHGARLSRRRSKSQQSEDTSMSLTEDSILDPATEYRVKVSNSQYCQACKYKQQLRLQNLLMFDHAIKKDNSSSSIIQLMIEHNLIEELIDYLRLNPNFSLNSKNQEGKPFIVLAAQSGSLEIVKYLISRNVQLNVKDLDGNTALHYAIAYQNYIIADELLQNGASPNIKNRFNLNPWNWQQYLLHLQ